MAKQPSDEPRRTRTSRGQRPRPPAQPSDGPPPNATRPARAKTTTAARTGTGATATAERPRRPASRRRELKAAPPPSPPPHHRFGAPTRYIAALLFAAFLVTVGLGAGIPRLQADARIDLLADPGSTTYQDQARFADTFGGDPVVVLMQPSGNRPLLTADHFVAWFNLEARLRRLHGVHQVYGPGSIVNTFAYFVTQRALVVCDQAGRTAEDAARKQAAQKGQNAQQQQQAADSAFAAAVRQCALTLAAEFPTVGRPALNNPDFIRAVILNDDGRTLRPYWNFALPDPNHALITVRMARTASLADVRAVENQITAGTRDPALRDTKMVTTGAPALTVALADAALPPVHSFDDVRRALLDRTLLGLLPATLIAMLLVTLFVLRVPYRLLAVPLAALAATWAGGAAGWLSLPVTPATLAVLPVVLGLTTDYSLQAANRLAEEEGDALGRVRGVARAILPPTLIAALATGLGVLAFALSPIPLVRQFAFFLALGVAAAYLVSVIVGLPLIVLLLRTQRPDGTRRPAPSWPALARAGRLPIAAVGVLALLGLPGWAVLNHISVETDPSHLVPQDNPAVRDAQVVQRSVGVGGELDLVLQGSPGHDAAAQAALNWVQQASTRVQSQSGGTLKPASSLPTFLSGLNKGKLPDEARTKTILAQMPGYFTQAMISSDHTLSRTPFAITKLTSVEQDRQLVSELNSLPSPPPGYRAYAAGLAVVASSALAQLTADQLKLNALALAVVLVVLLVAYRHPLPAVLAVVPTAVAAGWATGIIFALGVHASPITILLAGVVVAFATEFSVLWLSRYRAERRAGVSADAASDAASRRIGPAVIASAAALVLGFGVLALSPVPMVRDFGIWSAVDLALATAAVLVLLPPLARQWLHA